MAWELEIETRAEWAAPEYQRVAEEIDALEPMLRSEGLTAVRPANLTRGYLLQGDAAEESIRDIAVPLLVDSVVEDFRLADAARTLAPTTLTVLRKPGVMDPVALSAAESLGRAGLALESVRTFRRFVFPEGTEAKAIALLAKRAFANDAIEQTVAGGMTSILTQPTRMQPFELVRIPLRAADNAALERISREGQLYLDIEEMQAIRDHYQRRGEDPTDIELETIAQTWSEHCSHKTLRGPYRIGDQVFREGILKRTIFHATRTLARDWCVSVFEDNAGIIRFDDEYNVCFKVETHNHPSAIEPYGGANTGLGGVIRDILGAGLGAKPVASTDVFCVASPETPQESLPAGVLHPRRVLKGIVAGVRDYGNRMGIPTVGGAVCCDPRYLGNPLVFCGTIGLMPHSASFGKAQAGDLIVALGGRTGRDGIHGATFSSGELTTESETVSGGAVQIGNAITEKMVQDVLLAARDRGLFHAVTDCGAGGFSSAVGEMGADIGATVHLEKAPLKYEGLRYTEIWISEAQERMVLAVPPGGWEELRLLCESEGVEAVVLGAFDPTGQLRLFHQGSPVGTLDMAFLHEGRPPTVREAKLPDPPPPRKPGPNVPTSATMDRTKILLRLLAEPNIASKEWIIRQYDHEVQGGSVLKPLVGVHRDGPGDAAVVALRLGSNRGIAIGHGIQPKLGDLDPYWMALATVDEAMRNVVAVGGDPDRTAILDNFCWGNTRRPEQLGTLLRAAEGCRDAALAFGTPFISGKDSLNNEFNTGSERIVIPPTLLISALAIVPDIRHVVSMDLKTPGNHLFLVGRTNDEWGGSHFDLVTGGSGGNVPEVDLELAPRTLRTVHALILDGLIRSCHDPSEGGVAVALAEMAFAGECGVEVALPAALPQGCSVDALLFAESPSRFLLEVAPDRLDAVRDRLRGLPYLELGRVVAERTVRVRATSGEVLIEASIDSLRKAWRGTFDW